MGCDKVFELSAIEMFDHNVITVCVYIHRSPYGEFYDFLSKLEVVINGVQVKTK